MERYIVTDGNGRALCLGRYGHGPDVLLRGSDVTLFYKRASALKAIRRTRRYARKENLPWDSRYCTKRATVNVE